MVKTLENYNTAYWITFYQITCDTMNCFLPILGNLYGTTLTNTRDQPCAKSWNYHVAPTITNLNQLLTKNGLVSNYTIAQYKPYMSDSNESQVLETFGITRPLSAKDYPYDNVVAEATFKIFKTELNPKIDLLDMIDQVVFVLYFLDGVLVGTKRGKT
ncbi:hypothetical protein ABHN03_20085 [Paenibacillus sp. NRS-1775]